MSRHVDCTPWSRQQIGYDLLSRIRVELPNGYKFESWADSAKGPFKFRLYGLASILVAERIVPKGHGSECPGVAQALLEVAIAAAGGPRNAR